MERDFPRSIPSAFVAYRAKAYNQCHAGSGLWCDETTGKPKHFTLHSGVQISRNNFLLCLALKHRHADFRNAFFC